MTVAILAFHLAAFLVLLVAAFGGRGGFLRSSLGLGLRRRGPTGDLPDNAGEALHLEASSVPLSTRRAGSVERAKSGVDSTLICLRTKFVISASVGSAVRIDSAILPSRPN